MALPWSLLKIFLLCSCFRAVVAETYNVRVATDSHVNVVSKNFLSFTVDPKYLFSSSEKYGSSQECICMAASLTPAYLRIAGPSTAHMTFHNSTITIDPPHKEDPNADLLNNLIGTRKRLAQKEFDSAASFEKDARKFLIRKSRQIGRRNSKTASISSDKEYRNILENHFRSKKKNVDKVQVTSDEWKRFSVWAKAAGFEIVFALNNEEKTGSGLWDPNTTLNILSVAEKEGVENIFWQLGYECRNQSIDEYLNDLQTLRVVAETFPGAARGWRVVGGDVTGCLRGDSRSDFKDYVALSLEMTDALMIDGNSSSYELERLSSIERIKLLRQIHASSTPLWVSESAPLGELSELSERDELSELERAAAWMASLGHAARRGAQVHFRELTSYELYQPTLSFYMALLFKNLVGERVLNVDMESSYTVLFAHCTSLRRQPASGAVTLYGANMDDEPARLSLKLSKREEGGDIMQFILSQDEEGNIIVNGREMSQEGDVRPVVRRVRPYKTLLINLPAKSFGFWVIANTKIEPCHYYDENEEEKFVEAEPVDNIKKTKIRTKRSVDKNGNDIEKVGKNRPADEYDVVKTGNKELDDRIEHLNNYLREIHNILRRKPSSTMKPHLGGTKKLRRHLLKIKNDLKKMDDGNKPVLSFIGNVLQFARNGTRQIGNNGFRNPKLNRNQIEKRYNIKDVRNTNNFAKRLNDNNLETIQEMNTRKIVSRPRRSIVEDSHELKKKIEDNEIRLNNAHGKLNEDYYNTNEDLANNIGKEGTELRNYHKDNLSNENEIDNDINDNKKLWQVLHNIQSQLKKMSEERTFQNEADKLKEKEKFVVRTEISDDGATINFKEQPNGGWVKSTFENIFYVVNDLNENMNKLWDALPLFE